MFCHPSPDTALDLYITNTGQNYGIKKVAENEYEILKINYREMKRLIRLVNTTFWQAEKILSTIVYNDGEKLIEY